MEDIYPDYYAECKTGMADTHYFSVQNLWNNKAATFIYSEEKKTLVYALQQIQSGGIARTGQAAAVTVVVMVVPILIFVLSESQILETMASSGLKD